MWRSQREFEIKGFSNLTSVVQAVNTLPGRHRAAAFLHQCLQRVLYQTWMVIGQQ